MNTDILLIPILLIVAIIALSAISAYYDYTDKQNTINGSFTNDDLRFILKCLNIIRFHIAYENKSIRYTLNKYVINHKVIRFINLNKPNKDNFRSIYRADGYNKETYSLEDCSNVIQLKYVELLICAIERKLRNTYEFRETKTKLQNS